MYIDEYIKVNIMEKNYLQSTEYNDLWEDFVNGYRKVVQKSGFELNSKFVHNKFAYDYFIKRISQHR